MPKGKRSPEDIEKFMIDSYANDLLPIKESKYEALKTEYDFWKKLAIDLNIDLSSKSQIVLLDYDIESHKIEDEDLEYKTFKNELTIQIVGKDPFKFYDDQRVHNTRKDDILFEGTYEECLNAMIWGYNFHFPPFLDDHYFIIHEFYHYGQLANPDYFKAKPFKD